MITVPAQTTADQYADIAIADVPTSAGDEMIVGDIPVITTRTPTSATSAM
jgi:hypothetical protein